MQTRFIPRMLLTYAAVGAMLTMSGCAGAAGPTFADLDREPTTSDTVPAALPDYALENVDPSTIRLVAEYEGTEVYLAHGTEVPVCILAYPDDESWVTGCSGPGLTVRGPLAPTYFVTADGGELPGNAEPISQNVAVLVSPLAE